LRLWLLHGLMAAVGINSRVSGVHVSLNDFVGGCITLIAEIVPVALVGRVALTRRCSDIAAIGLIDRIRLTPGSSWIAEIAPITPIWLHHVVVIHLAMNAVIPIQVVKVHVVVDNLPVYADVPVTVIDVYAVHADAGS